MMDPKNWSQINAIFNDAVERRPEDRSEFLDAACGGNADLRTEVESLLSAFHNGESFLEVPIVCEPTKTSGRWRLTNDQIISHFRIISPIASGGMGEVYLAEDQKLHRHVALKVLPEQMSVDKDRMRRFHREARSVSRLNHPNILTIFEFGDHDTMHFFASEFVEGETLRERLIRIGRLPLSESLDIGIQIASALRAAHAASIIHRDIKPENIMIREDGVVKILDFGLAKLTERPSGNIEGGTSTTHTQPGLIMGTATYMSPEQARAGKIDARSDLFSFGVVLFEMLTGQVPFVGETMSDVIAALIRQTPRRVRTYNRAVPKELERLVMTCLEKEPDERCQSAADLLADLKRVAKRYESTHETLMQRTFPPTDGVPTEILSEPRGRRWRLVKSALVAAGVLAAIVAIYAFVDLGGFAEKSGIAASPTNSAQGDQVKPASRLYWEMSDDEQMEFLRRRFRHIEDLLGDVPTDPDDNALRIIKGEVDKYVQRKDSLSEEPFEEGLRAVYGLGSQFAPAISREFEARGIPPVLGIYQAMIESEYHACFKADPEWLEKCDKRPGCPKKALGVGLFQFSRGTGEKYDMAASQRCDVEKQITAAARYMSDLISDFGQDKLSATLYLLAFHDGEEGTRIYLRQLRRRGITERNFWVILRYNEEFEGSTTEESMTDAGKMYVPRFFAAAIMGETPEAFDLPTPPLTTLNPANIAPGQRGIPELPAIKMTGSTAQAVPPSPSKPQPQLSSRDMNDEQSGSALQRDLRSGSVLKSPTPTPTSTSTSTPKPRPTPLQ